MKWLLCCVVSLGLLTGCGDDDGADAGSEDTAPDVVEDVMQDVAEDVSEDAVADVAEDVAADVAEDVAPDVAEDTMPDTPEDTAPARVITDIEAVRTSAEHSGEGSICIQADCPLRKVVLGVGGRWGESIVPDVLRAQGQSRAVLCGTGDAGESWAVEAICGNVTTRRDAILAVATLPANAGRCITATCPEGMVAVGGGGRWRDSVSLTANRPTASNAWSLCGISTEEAEWEVDVICVEGAEVNTVTREGTSPAFDRRTCVNARCPTGQVLVSGGGAFDSVRLLDSISTNDLSEWAVCGASDMDRDWAADALCVP